MQNKAILLILLMLSCSAYSQTILGNWKTIDDDTGKARSIISIYEEDGMVYGKIIDILDEEKVNKKCIKCRGDRKNKPILGMIIMENLKKSDDKCYTGKILHPGKGKKFRCKAWINGENPNELFVRGYIAFLYRTQKWIRIS